MEPQRLVDVAERPSPPAGGGDAPGEPGSRRGSAVRGGLCRLGPRLVAFIDRRLAPPGRCRQLAQALTGLDFGGMYLWPALRQLLEGDDESDDSEDR